MLGVVTKSEKVTLWQQIFLIFVMPFNFLPSVVGQTFEDLHRATLLEAQAKGIL